MAGTPSDYQCNFLFSVSSVIKSIKTIYFFVKTLICCQIPQEHLIYYIGDILIQNLLQIPILLNTVAVKKMHLQIQAAVWRCIIFTTLFHYITTAEQMTNRLVLFN